MYGSLYIQIIMIGLVVSGLVYALWQIRKSRKTLNFNKPNNQIAQVIRAHPIVMIHTDDPLHYQISSQACIAYLDSNKK